MDTTPVISKATDDERAALATELTKRVTSTAIKVIEQTEQLKQLVSAFSVHHGDALSVALAGLPDALEELLPDLAAVTAHPASWDRHK